jgi:predicted acylesterase/phospholipase RssA
VATPARALALAALAFVLVGCAGPINARLDRYDAAQGYRFERLSADGNTGELFVILAFSGGGTRAAAFSFGVMEGLRDATYAAGGARRSLLADVDVISSVSGGSFTAAYYALFPERFFDAFPDAFLYRDIHTALIGRALWPTSWARLARPGFDRINLAAELYDDEIFEHRTFADLLRRPRRPYLILNATDMTVGRRFEFTQEQFDLLCSDLSTLPVATAVAASSAFPGLLSPLTLRNFAAEGCGYAKPQWLQDALVREDNPAPRYLRARDLASYQDDGPARPWIHLLDGGLADNIGLRGPYAALSSEDSGWSIFSLIDQKKVRRVVVITANAKTKKRPDWDRRQSAPGLVDVLGLVASGPMDNYSLDTVQLIRDHFARLDAEARTWAACRALLQEKCPQATMPGRFTAVDWHALELSFDGLADEALRRCMEGLPTSFTLPRATVSLLREVGRILLLRSPEFLTLMQALDPAWQPPDVRVDPALQAEVCGAG